MWVFQIGFTALQGTIANLLPCVAPARMCARIEVASSKMFEDDDIQHLLREEASRGGRGKFDAEERKRLRKLRASFLQLLRESDEQGFIDWLWLRGWDDDSPQFRELLALWREYRKREKL